MRKSDRQGKHGGMGATLGVFLQFSRQGLFLTTALQAAAVVNFMPMLITPAAAQLAPNTAPTGGNVVAGQASIAQSAAQTTITQASQRAAVNWQSFDVGSQHTVRFDQPSTSAVTLNRVVGPDPSAIEGRIQANGQVVIINQAGVVFGAGAQVDTAGLAVSAAGITDANFMSGGKLAFDQAAKPGAKIENKGTITIRNQGLAALVAPQVSNSGVISARMGKVILAGAEATTLDLYGDGLVSLNVTQQVRTAPNGATALVTNTGAIEAQGGTVLLTAQAVDGVIQNLVNAGGKISANSTANQTGRVLVSGRGGDVQIVGTISAAGRMAGTTGGSIEINPTGAVAVASGAKLNASGRAGGGTVAVGTTLARAKGGPSVTAAQTAQSVTINAGASITADATNIGNGGNVTILSSQTTTMDGSISAKGGANGGDGGFVEVSGALLSLTGLVDTTAKLGKTGTLLLDPSDLYISDLAPNAVTSSGTITKSNIPFDASGAPNGAPGTAVPSWLKTSILETAGATSNISLGAAGNILFGFSTGKSNSLNIGTHGLTMTAGGNISVDRGFAITAGTLVLDASSAGAITLGSTAITVGLNAAGDFTGTSAANLAISNTLQLSAKTGITLNDSVIGGATSVVDLGVGTSGGVSQLATGTINAGTVKSTNGIAGGATLIGTANAIGTIGAATITGAGLTVVNSKNLEIAGPLSAAAGAVAITTTGTGAITLTGDIVTGANPVTLTSAKAVTQTGGTITAAGLAIIAAGTVSLPNANAVSTIAGAVSGAGNSFLFRNKATDLTVGIVSGTTGIATANGRIALATTGSGTIAVSNAIASTGGEIDLAAAPGSGISNAGGIVSGGGTVVLLGDTLGLSAGGTLSAGTGTVVLGPSTTSVAIALGGASSSGTLGLQAADLAPITASALQIGYRATDASATFSGPISIGGSANLVLDPAKIPTLLLVTGGSGGTITQTKAIGFSAAGGSLGLISGGNVTLTAGNTIGTLAAFANSGGNINVTNAQALSVGTMTPAQLGVTLAANGLASSGTMAAGSGNPSNPLSGVTTSGAGTIAITTTTGALSVGAGITAAGTPVILSGAGINLNTGAIINTGTGALDLTSTSTIQQNGGSITAGTLRSTGGAGGTVNLISAGNTIGTLGNFAVSNAANSFTLTNAGTLQITGSVSADASVGVTTKNDLTIASTGTLVSASGPVSVNVTAGALSQSGLVRGNSVSEVASTAITHAGSTDATATSATLNAQGGTLGVSGTVTSVTAATLTGNTGLINSGAVKVSGTAGVATLTATTGTLAQSGTVQAAGTAGAVSITAAAGNLSHSGLTSAGSGGATLTATAGSFTQTAGTIAASNAGTVSISGNGGIAQNGGTISTTGLIKLNSGGAITQAATGGVLIAGTLSVVTTGPGDVRILNPNNQILSSNGMTVNSGSLVVVDDPTLTLTGTYSGKSLFFEVTQAGDTIALGAGGTGATLTAASGGRIAIIADKLTSDPASTLVATGGTVEFAPFSTTVAMSLGGTAQPLAIDSGLVSHINTGALVIGQFTDVTGSTPSTVINAASIALDGSVALGGTVAGTLFLASRGGIAQTAALTAASLALGGTAGALVSLPSISVGTLALGGFKVTGGDLVLTNAGTLNATGAAIANGIGSITANNISLTTAGTLNPLVVSGALATNNTSTGKVLLTSSSGGITFTATEALTAGTLDVTTTNGGTITQDPAGKITAGTLLSTGSATGTVNLAGTANAVSVLGNFPVSGAGNSFTLINTGLASNGTLAITGTVTADSGVTIRSGGTAMSNTGTILSASGAVILTTTAGDITQSGLVRGTSVAETASGALTQSGSTDATVTTATLVAQGGTLALTSAGTVTAVTAAGLTASSDLTQNGIVSVSGAAGAATLLSSSGTITQGGTVKALGSVTETATNGGLVLNGGAVATAPTVQLNGKTGIQLNGSSSIGQSAGTVDLNSSAGGVTQAATGIINAGTLKSTNGANGTVNLAGTANTIGTLANFAVSGGTNGFTLVNTGTLGITGTVSAPGTVAITTGTDLTNTGTVLSTSTAAAVSLTATAGTLSNAGLARGASLFETAGSSLTQSGTAAATNGSATLIAQGTTLNVTSTGIVTATAGATLTAQTDLINSGSVSATASGSTTRLTSNTGTITQTGTATAIGSVVETASLGAVVLNGNAVAKAASVQLNGKTGLQLNGASSIGQSGGFVDLNSSAGSVSQTSGSSVITAGTLLSSASVFGSATLNGANQIANIGNFSANGFTLNNGQFLTVQGALNGGTLGSVAITNSASLNVASTGTVSALHIAGTATAIGIGGKVTDGGAGTTSLNATTGSITETGFLTAGTLTGGSSLGSTSLTGTNQIANLGTFAGGSSLALTNNSSLTVIGAVGAATIVFNNTGDFTQAAGASIAAGSTVTATVTGNAQLNGTVSGLTGAFNATGTLIFGGALTGFALNPALDASKQLANINNFPTVSSGTGLFGSAPQILVQSTASITAPATAIPGASTDVVFHVTNNGTITFEDLYAPTARLWLDADQGQLTGQINVKSLYVRYTPPGFASAVSLYGVVDGVAGQDAASRSFILPLPKNSYLVNSCPIQSVNCRLIPTIAVPVVNPLNEVEPGAPPSATDELVVLPDVAERDY